MTCEEWIDEYHENKRSKDLHSVFNGRKVFDEAEGELSIAMCAKELGVAKCNVNYYVRTGRLRTFRKGAYHVILRSEFERFVREEMTDTQEVANNA